MLDRQLRRALDRPLTVLAQPLAARMSANAVSAVGLAAGAGACVAIASGQRWLALILWLANRLLDGIDGAVARLRGPTAAGGFTDIVADFAIYAGFIVGVAIDRPGARLAAVVVVSTYYVSGAAFLAWSAIAAELRAARPDNRSLHFLGGIAEGAETIAAYSLLCLWPSRTEEVLWVFAALVAVTALQRIAFAHRAGRELPADR